MPPACARGIVRFCDSVARHDCDARHSPAAGGTQICEATPARGAGCVDGASHSGARYLSGPRARVDWPRWPPRSIPVSQTPPTLVRRRRRSGAGGAHLAPRGRARQGPSRLPVRRLARYRQDLDGEDPRLLPELRAVDPTVEPCGQCDSCRSIASATSLDVIEMDAASNNSVDDIRELRESVVFAPVSGRHKVYILDEAHMLSQAAWNAFLKTLEEPPRTRCSCSPRPRPPRCRPPSSIAATASTSTAHRRADRKRGAACRRRPSRSRFPRRR